MTALEEAFAKRWAVDYWKPGHHVFEAAKTHAQRSRRLLFFVCKTCGVNHLVRHDPSRPSLTALPETLTTARNALGEHYFTCVSHG